MKTKFFTLFAAFTLLFGAKAMAQTDGDVNGDGKVDEQDITAIIQIMQEAGGVKEQTKYYWYAGWTEPTAANIATIVDEEYPVSKTDATSNKAGGYRTTNSGFNVNNFFAEITTNRYYSTAKTNYYIVVPNNMGIYSSNSPTTSVLSTFTKHSEFNNHIVYKSQETSRNINFLVVY